MWFVMYFGNFWSIGYFVWYVIVVHFGMNTTLILHYCIHIYLNTCIHTLIQYKQSLPFLKNPQLIITPLHTLPLLMPMREPTPDPRHNRNNNTKHHSPNTKPNNMYSFNLFLSIIVNTGIFHQFILHINRHIIVMEEYLSDFDIFVLIGELYAELCLFCGGVVG